MLAYDYSHGTDWLEIVVPTYYHKSTQASMGNLFSSRRTLQLSIVGIVTVVGWAARAKIWRKKAVPSQASNLLPEWQNLVHRNYYGRRRFQIDPNSDRQNMLRDFALISMKDSANYMERVRRLLRYSPSFESNRPKMRNYLARREMPEHLYIAPETVIDMGTYLALKTPHYRNGNILEFVRGKLELVSNPHHLVARAHWKLFSSCKSRTGLHSSTASESSMEICIRYVGGVSGCCCN